jgi:hypothetical protein
VVKYTCPQCSTESTLTLAMRFFLKDQDMPQPVSYVGLNIRSMDAAKDSPSLPRSLPAPPAPPVSSLDPDIMSSIFEKHCKYVLRTLRVFSS